MWFRFLSIVSLKWVANVLAMLLLLRFLIPHAWTGFLKAAPIWVVSFVIAFLFAEWALATRLPNTKNLFQLILTWIVVSYLLNILGSVFLFQTARVALYGTDLHLTSVMELLAILLAASVIRRRKLQAVLGEGMTA